MVIIPAIDIRNGRCVRLVQGDRGRELAYADDPVAVATRWAGQGARWLHVVDLDGALAGHPVHLELLRAIVQRTGLPVQAGGGFRTCADIDAGLAAGAARVVVGTAALRLGEQMGRMYGERVAASLDITDGRVAVNGWTEVTEVDPITLGRRLAARGMRRFIITSIGRDGTLAGPDVRGVRAFTRAVDVPVIAAGGIASATDVIALSALGVEGVIVGRALYEGRVDLAALRADRNVPAC